MCPDLTGNRTRDLLVHGRTPHQQSHTSQGQLGFHFYEMGVIIPILEDIKDLMGWYYSHFMAEETKALGSLSKLLQIAQLKIKPGTQYWNPSLCDSKLPSVPTPAGSQGRFLAKGRRV